MRSALIPESRFGRYFFYAFGEIVLVVIGILIAVQINNLNENETLKKDQLYKNILVFSFSRVGYIADRKRYCITECERVIKLIDAELNKSK